MAFYQAFPPGRIRFSATFTSVSGTAFDPTSLTFTAQEGVGTDTESYPGTVVRDGVGVYHFDYLAANPGLLVVTWASTQSGFECSSSTPYTITASQQP